MSNYGWGSQRDRDALDRYITGNYGEDQHRDECADSPSGQHEANRARYGDDVCIWCLEPFGKRNDICGAPLDDENEEDGAYCINAFPCSEHPLKVAG